MTRDDAATAPVSAEGAADRDEPAIAPLYQRTHILVGDVGIARLRRARVLVAGLGGVGSFVAEALARAGVGDLTLVDFDRVAPSNLNRQLVALGSTVGELKSQVMAARIREINPDCRLKLIERFLEPEAMPDLLAEGFDQVADAIDSLASKVALITAAVHTGTPIVSSMGAGGRLDPTRVRVGDLMDTSVCPLARVVRNRLRKAGMGRGISVVWSDETYLPPLPPEPTGYGRPRAVNGTISYLPALFGLMLAGVLVQRILASQQANESVRSA
jgi:tRNA threonylcarbamoyladenosine dehydratase